MGMLTGIRVVDLSRYLSGPTVTMLLGDLGARIVKVEGLPYGDPARISGPFDGQESVYFMSANRNKQSVAVNLRSDVGRELVRRLATDADVLVQNFRPGVAAAMGLGWDDLRVLNPRLVYLSVSGFGLQPPGSDYPGFDQTAQAMSGLMSVTGTAATGPLRVGIPVGDSSTGVFGAVAVLAALLERNRTQQGRHVAVSLIESMLTMMSYQAQRYLSLGQLPGQDGNDHPLLFPQGTFQARDGQITLASGNEKMWRVLCEALELEQYAEDPDYVDNAARYANRARLRQLIERRLAERNAAEWVDLLNLAGIPASPVLDVGQALAHPLAAALDMVADVEHATLGPMKVVGRAIDSDGDDDWLRLAPPTLGQHTIEICREAGLDEATITEMIEAGVIR